MLLTLLYALECKAVALWRPAFGGAILFYGRLPAFWRDPPVAEKPSSTLEKKFMFQRDNYFV